MFLEQDSLYQSLFFSVKSIFYQVRDRTEEALSIMAEGGEGTLVLVTGASGFIATHVVKQLQEAGYRVRGKIILNKVMSLLY